MSSQRFDSRRAVLARDPRAEGRNNRMQLAGSELARMLEPAGVTVTSCWDRDRGQTMKFEAADGSWVELISVPGGLRDPGPGFDAIVRLGSGEEAQ